MILAIIVIGDKMKVKKKFLLGFIIIFVLIVLLNVAQTIEHKLIYIAGSSGKVIGPRANVYTTTVNFYIINNLNSDLEDVQIEIELLGDHWNKLGQGETKILKVDKNSIYSDVIKGRSNYNNTTYNLIIKDYKGRPFIFSKTFKIIFYLISIPLMIILLFKFLVGRKKCKYKNHEILILYYNQDYKLLIDKEIIPQKYEDNYGVKYTKKTLYGFVEGMPLTVDIEGISNVKRKVKFYLNGREIVK